MGLVGEETFEYDVREGSDGVGYESTDNLRDDLSKGTVEVVGCTGTRE
jgi:hypothetical protein